MVTHASADSDMSIVYFSMTINDKNKGRERQNYWRDCQISTNGRICYTKYCRVVSDRPYVFSEFLLRQNFGKTSIKKTMA